MPNVDAFPILKRINVKRTGVAENDLIQQAPKIGVDFNTNGQ